MDSITQAALGAGIVGATLGRHVGRKAILAGAALGTLPDLDVVIRHADPLTAMISHRGFSHSVIVLTLLSIALTALTARWLTRPEGPGTRRLFMAIWLTLITHPLLDALTAYGTQLLWPFKPTPASWSSLFIIDPFFTLPLLGAVLYAACRGCTAPRCRAIAWALGWCVLYIALSLGFKQLVEQRARAQLAATGHTITAVFSTPQPFNILLWRVIARADDGTYHEAIHSVLDTQPAESLQHTLNHHLAPYAADQAQGLHWFAGDWVRYDIAHNQLVVSDLRMGLAAGFYSFQFVVAERDPITGAWQAVTPYPLRGARGTDQLGRVWHRIRHPHPPLPLSHWAQQHLPTPETQP